MLTKIELSKAKLALFSPEMISLTSKLAFVESEHVPTMGTDGRRVFYNKEWVESLTLQQCIGVICHEIGHNMLAHPARIGHRDKQRANWAMDVVLNQNLQDYFIENKNLKAELPPGGVFGPEFNKYKGWNWEKVYADDEKNGCKMSKKFAQFDFVEPGVNEDGTPMTTAQCEALAKEWTMAAQQAATMAKARGLSSGIFEEFVSGITKTRVDWRSQLWDVFTKTSNEDQSYRRFNRKFLHAEIYLPGMYSERIDSVGVFQDTSGSMSSEEFKLGLGCLNEILESVKPEKIVFGCCDTGMKSVEELTADDLPIVAKPFKGRGGTVLTPIFEYVKDLEEPLELVVIVTDGQTDVIAKNLEPSCPVVWLVTTDSTQAAENSFGKIVRVEV